MIERPIYLNKIISKMNNGLIKIITGIRRCGKSYLLFNLFYNYLVEIGVDKTHIITLQLDDRLNIKYRDPDVLCEYIHSLIKDSDNYYILLDEVQYVAEFEDVLNSFLHIKNADIYVTGSNAKFLSSDIITEFRGRGDQIHLFPLSFSEYYGAVNLSFEDAFREYSMFGGMPFLLNYNKSEEKINYLNNLFKETYIKDIVNRNNVKRTDILEDILNIISSSIGSLNNPNKLANVFRSSKNEVVSALTIKQYLDYCCDSFLINKAYRYDVKGKKYIETPLKYYFTDLGLRNARLGFRQYEVNHIMENIIYNELLIRGYNVDVGVVTISEKNENENYVRKQLEIDFVCNKGFERVYIQSALNMDSDTKKEQEERSLINVDDSFKKVIIVKDGISKYIDDKGVLVINLKEFLLNENCFKD